MATSGAYGSSSRPVSLDPFGDIIEVGWPSRYYIAGRASVSIFTQGETCSGAVDTATGSDASIYINLVQLLREDRNGINKIMQPLRSGNTKVGTITGFPTGTVSQGISPWLVTPGYDESGSESASSVVFRIRGLAALNRQCKILGGFSQGYVVTPGGAVEFHAFNVDYGAVSFIENDTGEEWAASGVEITARSAADVIDHAVPFRVLMRKVPEAE